MYTFVWIADGQEHDGKLAYLTRDMGDYWMARICHPVNREVQIVCVNKDAVEPLETNELDYILITMGRIAQQVVRFRTENV